MGADSEIPLVSVVTPALNAAEFLEETIRSVLTQGYPRLEYLVMDGGSTDGTVEILEKHRGSLRWVSAPDGGTADAVNRGVAQTKGSIVAWLSADDTYFPGAVAAAVRAFQEDPDAAVVYGEGVWTDREGRLLGPYPVRAVEGGALARECVICQPAAFVRREVFEKLGGLDRSLQVCFDYEFWMRVAAEYRLRKIGGRWATARMHAANKSLGQRREVYAEAFRILRKHYGYVPHPWIYGRSSLWLDARDQFLEPLRRSGTAFLLALPTGLWHNRRAPVRFLGEWIREAGRGLARRATGR